MIRILLLLASAFAIYHTIRTKKAFPAVISLGMVAGILVALFTSRGLKLPGLYIYMVFLALALFYGIIVPDKKIRTRMVIMLMSSSIFVYWLWVLNHWHGNTLLMPMFTLLVGLIGIFNITKLKNEWGFLTILAVDAMAILIENWIKVN